VSSTPQGFTETVLKESNCTSLHAWVGLCKSRLVNLPPPHPLNYQTSITHTSRIHLPGEKEYKADQRASQKQKAQEQQ